MASSRQLLRSRESSRAGAYYRYVLAGFSARMFGQNPPLGKGVIDDLLLNRLNRDRRSIDPQHTRRFARGRTDASGELREIVGRVQSTDRLAPTVLPYQVIPVRDEVIQRTSGMAKRDAAVHASGALLSRF